MKKQKHARQRQISALALLLFALLSLLAGCREKGSPFSPADVPAYDGEPYTIINDNKPYFTKDDETTAAFEYYSELDAQGRCGVAYANICKELMPTEERESIGQVKPSGWHTVRYDDVIVEKYLYNRCHLIGYQLAGENANEKNLITGTRYFNVQGMLDHENMVARYVDETGNHVLYRVTPCFEGDNLVANGVLMEGYSVEDHGAGICFCIFAYNIQPGIVIDYATGNSWREAPSAENWTDNAAYIGNIKSGVFHVASCTGLPAEKNRVLLSSREQALAEGYTPCSFCNP